MEMERGIMKSKGTRYPEAEDRDGMEDREPAVKNRRISVAFLIVGAFIFALVAFVSGVRLGKSLTDSNLEEKLLSQSRVQLKVQEELPFHTEGKPPEVVRGQETKLAAKEPSVNKKEKEEPPLSSIPELGEQKPDTAIKESAAAAEKLKKPPAPKPKYTVQVAALNNADEAREMVNQLRSRGYAAYEITGTAAAKGTWHRVRVGYFQTLPEARQFALGFEQKEKIKPIITSVP